MSTRMRILAVITAMLVSGNAADAQSSRGENALLGGWAIEVKAINPPPGVQESFSSMITFAPGGATSEHNGFPGWGPATGSWEFVKAGEFKATWLKYIWVPQSGQLVGIAKIRGTILMKSDDEYEGKDQVDFYLPDGTLAGSWEATATAKRIKVEN